ncbi:hypothetical protein GIB67_005601 [Kingdonia uniflora]|uniref:Uncharacterized protein n=1 Tax=Kingdonia uniflora TaxID=39325 RepID=A0A7J7NHR0_9MAGN|nr:hypothetical protein GIB67_005601 [Kingdonia uniflora]
MLLPQSLMVNNFYFGMGVNSSGVPTKMPTVNGSLKISTYNPASFFNIHVTSMYVNLMYTEIPIATGQIYKKMNWDALEAEDDSLDMTQWFQKIVVFFVN